MERKSIDKLILQQNIMTSLNSDPLSIKAMGNIMWPLGFITYGGPLAHVNVLRAKFSPQYISEEDFNDLFALGQTLPGPTSTQMVIAIGTNLTHSCLGGFVAFLYFSMPASIVLLLFGLFIPELDSNSMKVILAGFSSAAVAIIGEACFKLSKNALKNTFLISLWIVSAILTFFIRTSFMAVLMIVIGAISNILYDRKNIQQVRLTESQEIPKMLFDNPLLGYRSLILYVSLFAIFIILQLDWLYYKVASGFFRSGSLVIGGGHVVLPLIQIELEEYITQQQFSDAFALVSCMPGPMFSIAIYLGAMIGGVPLALISQFFMFLPGFFTIFGLLPYWKQYKDIKIIKAALNGIAAVTTGFIVSTIVHMLIEQTSQRFFLPFLISALSCIALYYKSPVPAVVIGGGFLNILSSSL
ncbi:hypothetical protein pb186bvf_011898 [Paramecium bursaria]